MGRTAYRGAITACPGLPGSVLGVTAQIEFGERKETLPRGIGGVVGLVYPSMLVGLALGVEFATNGGLHGFGTAYLGALLFVIAAPTAWLFAIDFIEAGRFTIIAFAVVTSFPVWFAVGAGLAGVSRTWVQWAGRYIAFASFWTVASLLLIGIIGSIAL